MRHWKWLFLMETLIKVFFHLRTKNGLKKMYKCCCWLYRRVQMLNNDLDFLLNLLNLILIWFLVSGVYGMVIQMFPMAFWFVQLFYDSQLKGLKIEIKCNFDFFSFRTPDLPTSANTNAKCRITTTSKRNWRSQSDFSSSVSQHLWIYCIIWIRKYIQTPETFFSQKNYVDYNNQLKF